MVVMPTMLVAKPITVTTLTKTVTLMEAARTVWIMLGALPMMVV
jgi:hypothetical protein